MWHFISHNFKRVTLISSYLLIYIYRILDEIYVVLMDCQYTCQHSHFLLNDHIISDNMDLMLSCINYEIILDCFYSSLGMKKN